MLVQCRIFIDIGIDSVEIACGITPESVDFHALGVVDLFSEKQIDRWRSVIGLAFQEAGEFFQGVPGDFCIPGIIIIVLVIEYSACVY